MTSNSSTPRKSEKTDIHVDLGSKHWRKLNTLAETHHGGNRTNALRRSIDRLEVWHEQEADAQRSNDAIKKETAELNEVAGVILEKVETLEQELAKHQEEGELPFDTGSEEEGQAAEEIYQVLAKSDQPLSIDGIVERTSLNIGVLGSGLEILIDKEMIQEASGGQTAQYQLLRVD